MFVQRTLGVLRPVGLRNVVQLSTRPRGPPTFSILQQSFNANDNSSRSFSWLFQEPNGTTATIRVSENERGEAVFEGSSLTVPPLQKSSQQSSTVPTQVNKQASYDFLFTELRSPFGNENAVTDVNRTKSSEFLFESADAKEQDNLKKVFETLVQEKRTKEAEEPLTEDEEAHVERIVRAMNRNARAPKKANRGRRPCSHVARRLKRMKRHKGW